MSEQHAAAALTAAAVIATILVARAAILHQSGRATWFGFTHRVHGRAASRAGKAVPSAVTLSDDATASVVREAEQHVHHCWQQLQTRVEPE
ncbi:hypothetical protein BIV25_20005 [Streptomyces sp. MUSC 14]|uniref:hypothetical protein n=1 Tax=Streptomyces sp. MUSC 14 TaxID=1354889 RepID=UPI0008F5C25C|nr:hypothetical protein [Streptomyces sp. MUSC 14]OIJ95735.1 hypothetical protein BIV25_20005 [Streptomyces sp. MUSC 14]